MQITADLSLIRWGKGSFHEPRIRSTMELLSGLIVMQEQNALLETICIPLYLRTAALWMES